MDGSDMLSPSSLLLLHMLSLGFSAMILQRALKKKEGDKGGGGRRGNIKL